MSFDSSRFSFNPWNDFSGVVMQQGRVQTDADWNEWLGELSRRIQAGTLDTMGRAVYPATTPYAFQIAASSPGGTNALAIGPGRMYVDGLLAENHGDPKQAQWDPALAEVSNSPQPPPPSATGALDYTSQPYMPAGTKLPGGNGPFLAYLDVWTRPITYLLAPDLVDKAIGIDTTGRLQTVWQVKLMDLSNSPGATCNSDISGWPPPASAGLLTTGTAPSAPSGPCCLTAGAAYTGTENQLYRVEIHHPGTPVSGAAPSSPLAAGTATFKWSRDNASVATGVTSIASAPNSAGVLASQLAVQSLGRDQVLGFAPGHWIEILDDDLELAGEPGELHQIDSIDFSAGTITLADPLGSSHFAPGDTDAKVHTRIQRWDQSGKVYEQDGTTVWWDTGTQGGDIPVPPAGTALLLESGIVVSFDLDPAITPGAFRTGDFWAFAARTADGSIEFLTDARPRGIHHHYARLSIVTFPTSATDCRTEWPPASESASCGCCCSVTVGDGGTFTSIQKAIDSLPVLGGEVCILPGRYFENVVIRDRRDVVLRGCGWQTRIASASSKPARPPSPNERGAPDAAPGVAAVAAIAENTLAAVITVASSQHVQLLSFAVEAAADEVGVLLDGTGTLSAARPPGNVAPENAVLELEGVLDVTLKDLVLTASTRPAVLANRVRLLQMEDGRVAMQNVRSEWPAVWVAGDEMRLLRNWVGVQSDATKRLWLPATVMVDQPAPGETAGTTVAFSAVTVHPGGIQIAGPSRDVFVLENEIEGGSRNGITLGSLSELDAQGKPSRRLVGVLVRPEDDCTPGGTLLVPISTPGSTATTTFVAGGKLVDIQIDRNRIRNTGLCGIGPVGYFDLDQAAEVVSIENLTIASNTISRTLLRSIIATKLAAASIVGYGAIALADAEHLTIRDNSIVDFGPQPGTSVCGIFVLHGEMTDISGNHVLETRDWSQPPAAMTASDGARGGIFIALATPPSFTAPPAASMWSLSSADLPVYIPSLPALRVENNTVRVPLGETLAAVGFGAFSIQNNHFSCGGTVASEGRPMASTVAIMNMGTAVESAASGFSSLFKGKNVSGLTTSGQRAFTNASTGAVLFSGNVCQLEARASGQRSYASVAVMTADHLIFADNQCWVDGPRLTVVFDALVGAGSLQLTSNRFQESADGPVTASGASFAPINIASQNLSTYCLINTGTTKLVDVNNVAMIDLASPGVCAALAQRLNP